jgi:hypothetical protein
MGAAVLDGDALAESGASPQRGDQLPQSVLEPFVVGNADCAVRLCVARHFNEAPLNAEVPIR